LRWKKAPDEFLFFNDIWIDKLLTAGFARNKAAEVIVNPILKNRYALT